MSITLTSEQLQDLIAVITSNNTRNFTFVKCPARYNGSRMNHKIEEFITTTTVYKETEQITDSNALKSLPFLLEGKALSWWDKVKEEATTWLEVINLIRRDFSPPRPAYAVYQDLFSDRQADSESTELFLFRKRSLLALVKEQIPEEHVQMDMLYGMMRPSIRGAVHRGTVGTFNELLEKAREVEQRHGNPASTTTTEESADPVENSPENPRKRAKRSGVRCSYCHYRGHIMEACEKKKAQLEAWSNIGKKNIEIVKEETKMEKRKTTTTTTTKKTPSSEPFSMANEIFCLGCGRDGCVRMTCPQCSKELLKSEPVELAFW